MNDSTQTTKRELIIFFVVAFGVPYLMGIPLAISQRAGNDTSSFANAQMFYPAAGVMLAFLLTHRPNLPLRFYAVHLVTTVACLVTGLLSVIFPSAQTWAVVDSWMIIIASILAWVLLLTEKKEKRSAYGLRWQGKGSVALGICLLFLFLETIMTFVSIGLEGKEALWAYWGYWNTIFPWLNLFAVILSFFVSFLPFLGEEYSWRYYLTPLFQKRFGKRRGVLLIGVLWGLWHLPLNLFFYSPETSLQSIVIQIVVCITLGVFFTFGYEVSGHNIWVPVLLHYLNNNMILVWSGTANVGNQIYTWTDIGICAVLYGVLFLPFLATKVFQEKKP